MFSVDFKLLSYLILGTVIYKLKGSFKDFGYFSLKIYSHLLNLSGESVSVDYLSGCLW